VPRLEEVTNQIRYSTVDGIVDDDLVVDVDVDDDVDFDVDVDIDIDVAAEIAAAAAVASDYGSSWSWTPTPTIRRKMDEPMKMRAEYCPFPSRYFLAVVCVGVVVPGGHRPISSMNLCYPLLHTFWDRLQMTDCR